MEDIQLFLFLGWFCLAVIQSALVISFGKKLNKLKMTQEPSWKRERLFAIFWICLPTYIAFGSAIAYIIYRKHSQ